MTSSSSSVMKKILSTFSDTLTVLRNKVQGNRPNLKSRGPYSNAKVQPDLPNHYLAAFVATFPTYEAFQKLLMDDNLLLQLADKSYCLKQEDGVVKAYLAFCKNDEEGARLKKHSRDLERRLFQFPNGFFQPLGTRSRQIWKAEIADDELRARIKEVRETTKRQSLLTLTLSPIKREADESEDSLELWDLQTLIQTIPKCAIHHGGQEDRDDLGKELEKGFVKEDSSVIIDEQGRIRPQRTRNYNIILMFSYIA